MADTLSTLQIQLEMQSAQFTAEMQKVNGQLNKLNKDVGGISAGFTKLGTVLKGAAVLGAFVAVAKGVSSMVDGIAKSIDAMDEMGKAAQKVGVAVETLSSLKFAAEQSGVGFEALQTGLKKLNQNLSDFDTGTSEAAESLRKMGIAVGDTTEQSLAKIADQFAKMPDGVQKTALAMNIFGKAGADLVPLLNAGSQGIEELQKRAKELGIVFDDISAKQAELFNDKMAEMKTVLEGIFTQISIGLLPVLSALTDELASSARVGGQWKSVGEALGNSMLDLAEGTIEAVEALISFGSTIGKVASIAATLVSIRLNPTGDGPANLVKQINEILDPKQVVTAGDKFRETIKNVRDRINTDIGEFQDIGVNRKGAGGGAGGGGKGSPTPFDAWIEGLKKTSQESELLGPKMQYVKDMVGELEAAGLKGSETWKVYNAELKKLEETAAAGSVGAELVLQIEKTREAANKTAESMVILGQKYHDFLEMGDVEGAQIVLKMMDDLRDKTKVAATEMEKLGEGITDAIAQNANNAVNSFIDSIGNAKISFGDFAGSVLKDIAKMIVQLLIMKPLMDSIKGFIGGFGGVSGKAYGDAMMGGTSLPQGIYHQPTFFKFANGGIPGSRTGVLAEAGRSEAIVPLIRHGKDLGVGASPVNVNVYNNAGVEVQTQSSEGSDGTKQIDIYIEKKVRDMVNSGGLDRSMRGAYGLTRVGA